MIEIIPRPPRPENGRVDADIVLFGNPTGETVTRLRIASPDHPDLWMGYCYDRIVAGTLDEVLTQAQAVLIRREHQVIGMTEDDESEK